MVNVQDFLINSNIEFGTYALVTYDNKTEPTYFVKYNFGNGEWFLESPCGLRELMDEVENEFNNCIIEYLKEILEDWVDMNEYIDEYVKHMIVNGVLYEIVNFQCSPYLPKCVDDIKLISERECLKYMLKID